MNLSLLLFLVPFSGVGVAGVDGDGGGRVGVGRVGVFLSFGEKGGGGGRQ